MNNKSGIIKAVVPSIPLDQPGILRICNIMAVLGMSRPSVYVRIEDGRIPLPDGDDGRPYWRNETIKKFLDEKYPVRKA